MKRHYLIKNSISSAYPWFLRNGNLKGWKEMEIPLNRRNFFKDFSLSNFLLINTSSIVTSRSFGGRKKKRNEVAALLKWGVFKREVHLNKYLAKAKRGKAIYRRAILPCICICFAISRGAMCSARASRNANVSMRNFASVYLQLLSEVVV